MRHSEKGASAHANPLFSVDFHRFIEKQESPMMELASEFGLSLSDVRKLKRQLRG